MPKRKYLVVNADDFGYSSERDAGILRCFQQGAISNVSLLVNGESAAEAARQGETAGLSMGLHLNLTEGKPVGLGPYRTLIDSHGSMLGKFGFRAAVKEGRMDMNEVGTEIQCQIDRFIALVGRKPVSVDGHQHIHVIPGVYEVFAATLQSNGVRVSRLPEENVVGHPWGSDARAEFMRELVENARQAHTVFTQHGIWAPKFAGLRCMGRDMTVDMLKSIILEALSEPQKENITVQGVKGPNNEGQTTQDGHRHHGNCTVDQSDAKTGNQAETENQSEIPIVCELMVHPGNRTGNCGGCGDGPDGFSQSEDREHEMAVLGDPGMAAFYKEVHVSTPVSMVMRQLIVNADDYGYSSERDSGMLDCFKRGAISNASVMVNGVSAESGVKLALQSDLPMGLHLNVTEGTPVGPGPYPTLTNPSGFFLGMFGLPKAVREGKVDLEEVRAEIQCQIDRFSALVGRKPVSVDGHQHAHVIPGLSEIFAAVLEKNGITKSRLPVEEAVFDNPRTNFWSPDDMKQVVKNAQQAKAVFDRHHIWYPAFTGLRTMSRDMSVAVLQEDIAAVYRQLEGEGEPAVCELMVHPGNRTGSHGGCGDGPDDFSQSEDREYEKAIICGREMREFYKAMDITLVSFEKAGNLS